MQAVCLHRNNFGQYCEKTHGHTGNHRARMFTAGEAQQAWRRQKHVGDLRWEWTGNGWLTTDPELVAEGMLRLLDSKSAR